PQATGSSGADGDPRGPSTFIGPRRVLRPYLAGDAGVLELVEPRPLGDELDDLFDGPMSKLGIALGSCHDPREHRSIVDDERRDTEHVMRAHLPLVGLAHL